MITQEAKDFLQYELAQSRFDCAAYAIIDFKQDSFETYQLINNRESNIKAWFDLASITKAMTLGGAWLAREDIFTPDMLLLLEHRAGLPFWGRLSRDGWRETVLQYSPKPSDTVYSDFSALRLTLEIERTAPLYSLTDAYRDSEVRFWQELPEASYSPITGWRGGGLISGEVHDDNCYVIGKKIGHAGLFGTIEGFSKTLLNYNRELGMIKKLSPLLHERKTRFVRGFDTVENLESTLAGPGCSQNTFGHLGFTGTSFWIDSERELGWVLLTNASYPYWYDRLKLNHIRRQMGAYCWHGLSNNI